MSEKQSITKFENLSNEIFINCFEYLNAPDLVYGFENLNPRFYRLVRTIPLCLNFEDVSKSIFDRFCEKMLDYPEFQKQIYSLKLSNENTHGQIHAFLTYFSLVEFTQLRSLVLIEIKENNVEELSSILPLLSQLTCLRLVNSPRNMDPLISKLPRYKPNTLSTSPLSSDQEIIPLTKLSVKFGMLNQYYQILPNIPFLQYLSIRRGLQFESVSSNDINLLRGRVNHLKYLVIDDCMVNTNNLMDIIAYMINLRSLTVSVYENSDIIDAFRWQHLITSSLPHLNIFRFRFGTFNRNEIIKKYDDFQSDFWITKHQWYTECLLCEGAASYIFTVPFLIDMRPLWFKYVRYCSTSVDNSKTFDNVTELYSPGEELMQSSGFYFPNITSLIIYSLPEVASGDDEQRFIRSLERTMNLLKLKHLEIPICSVTKRATILLEILKKAPHLSSLNTFNCVVDIFKTNREVCRYTSEMIKKLQFNIRFTSNPCQNFRDVSSVHEVFPNIEEMTCSVSKPDTCLLLLHNLPKLSKLTVTFLHPKDLSPFYAVKEELSKLKNIFFYEDIVFRKEHVANVTFSFWVNRG